MDLNVVDVRSVERRFGPTLVLRSLDLSVRSGERVAIFGANGSGKTTLLRVIAGLLRPSAGVVRVFDGDNQHPDVRKRIGVASHTPALYPRLSAFENVRFWAAMYDDPDGAERGRDLLLTLELDPDDKRPVASYSQGMRQRASIARTLCTKPDLVLADEPFAGLDPSGADVIAALLNAVPTVVIATHDSEHTKLARRLVMRDGRLHAA